MIWDSHPLALGATPAQVFIDGIPQLETPYVVQKPTAFQATPKTPNFNREAEEALKYDGLPPLLPTPSGADIVVFTNVKSITVPQAGELAEVYTSSDNRAGVAVVKNGSILCFGEQTDCLASGFAGAGVQTIDLHGGAISPALLSYGAPLGLQEIAQESSTGDGVVYDPLTTSLPNIIGSDTAIRAVDGLQFSGRSELCETFIATVHIFY